VGTNLYVIVPVSPAALRSVLALTDRVPIVAHALESMAPASV
jgi:hypothetical protein